MTLEARMEEIRHEHARRIETIGHGPADTELYTAFALAENRYDEFAHRIASMFEATSDRMWLIKFYEEHLTKINRGAAE
jgi:hypothetical protein